MKAYAPVTLFFGMRTPRISVPYDHAALPARVGCASLAAVRLHNYWRSSASWRVRIALAWKGLPYTYVPVDLLGRAQHEPGYVVRNPIAQVPTLELPDGRCLSESMAILEYLEEVHPRPPLLPAEPWTRARTRQLAEIVNAGIQPYQNAPTVLGYVRDALGGDERAWARHFIARGLAALEGAAAPTAGRFLVGGAPTFADVFLVPQLHVARRFDVELAGLPTLLRVEAACLALEAFTAAHPDRQPDAPAAASG